MMSRCVLALVFLGFALPAPCWQSGSGLRIDRIKTSNGLVTFDTHPGMEDSEAASEIRIEPQPVFSGTTDQKYTLYFLPSKIRAQNGGSYISYVFYLVDTVRPQSYIRYTVGATSYGSFLDEKRETKFHVNGSEGPIEIPIFCPGRPNLVDVTRTKDKLIKVPISGADLAVTLKNLSGLGLSVRLNEASGPEVTTTPLEPGHPYLINAGGQRKVSVRVKPSVFRALIATSAEASAESPHGWLNLNMEYEFSDYKAIQLAPPSDPLPLEFEPKYWHLGGVVALGALVGWMLCLLISIVTGYRRTAGVGKLLARLAVALLLGWILDIASAVTNSRVVFLGLDLNPTRLPPAFVLGVISGVLGAWYLDRVVNYIDNRVSSLASAKIPEIP